MKKWMGGLAGIAALLCSTGAMAEGYISAAIGQGHQAMDCTGASSCSTSDTAFKLVGGLPVAQGVSVEIGYLDYGKVRASSGFSAVEIQVSSFTLGGALKLPLTPELAANLRMGLASMTAKGKYTGMFAGSSSETKGKLYFGLGATYAITKAAALEVGADFSQAELDGDKADVRALTVGMRFSF